MGDYREYVGLRVVVVMGDYSIDGTLSAAGKQSLKLRDAALVSAGDDSPIDGAVVIPAASVTWVQVP